MKKDTIVVAKAQQDAVVISARKSRVKFETPEQQRDAKLAAVETKVEQARESALRASDALAQAEEELLALMGDYDVIETPKFKLVARAGSFKMVGAKGVQLEQIQYSLKGDVSAEFIDTKLNLAKLHAAMQFDKSITGVLKHYGVEIVQGDASVSLRRK